MKRCRAIQLLLWATVGLPAGAGVPTWTLLSHTPVDPDAYLGDSAGPVDAPKGSVTGCSFSADGRYLAAGDFKATGHLFAVASDGSLTRLFRVIHATGVSGVDGEVGPAMFSPDGAYFTTGINARGLKVWRVADGLADADGVLQPTEYAHWLTASATCDGARWSPDGRWLAAGSGPVLRLYERPDFREVAAFVHPGPSSWEVNSIDFATDPATGDLLVLSGSGSGNSGTVLAHRYRSGAWSEFYRWSDQADAAPAGSIKLGGIGGSVKTLRVSPDGRLFGYGARNGLVAIHEVVSGARVVTLPCEGNRAWLPGDDADSIAAVEAVAWSSCGRYFFVGGLIDGVLRTWRRGDWSLAAWVQAQCTLGPRLGRSDEGLRAIEFLDVWRDWVAVAGDEGTVQLYRFVAPAQEPPFAPDGMGRLIWEAEDFHGSVAQGLAGPETVFNDTLGATRRVRSVLDGVRQWLPVEAPEASGGGAVQAWPNDGSQISSQYQTHYPRMDAPKLDYRVYLPEVGTYYVWVRARAQGTSDNSCHVGLDRTAPASGAALNLPVAGRWAWAGADGSGQRRSLTVAAAGLHTLNLWMRESGFQVDQILLVRDVAYTPPDAALPPGVRHTPSRRVADARVRPQATLGHFEVFFPRLAEAAGFFYSFEASQDLTHWSSTNTPQRLQLVPLPEGRVEEVWSWSFGDALGVGEGPRFIRLCEEWLGGP